MKSLQRTKVLYDDPNSYFKASVYEFKKEKTGFAKSSTYTPTPSNVEVVREKVSLDAIIKEILNSEDKIIYTLMYISGNDAMFHQRHLIKNDFNVLSKLNKSLKLLASLFKKLSNFSVALFEKGPLIEMLSRVNEMGRLYIHCKRLIDMYKNHQPDELLLMVFNEVSIVTMMGMTVLQNISTANPNMDANPNVAPVVNRAVDPGQGVDYDQYDESEMDSEEEQDEDEDEEDQ